MDRDRQERCRIKINLTTGELEAEGSKQFVEKILGEYGHKLKTVLAISGAKQPLPGPMVTSQQSSQQFQKKVNIKDFYLEKKPRNDKEATAVVAFYLSEIAEAPEKKMQINKEILRDYLKLAHHQLPTNIAQTLLNTKFTGYLESGDAAGEFKLGAIGYNLVAHQLPGEQTGLPERITRKQHTPKKGKIAKKK